MTVSTTPIPKVDSKISERLVKLDNECSVKESKINELFNMLVEGTQNFEDLELSTTEKYDTLITYEYLLTRLRFLVADELRRIDFALSNEQVLSGQEKAFYNRRKTYLLSVNARLNDIREDLNVLQRTTYFMKERF